MIVIPMAGLSSRFFKAGYDVPKYQLPLWGETVFYWVIKSFEAYFTTDEFLFIVREDYDTPRFVENEAKKLGIQKFTISTLQHETQGQAETVFLGINDLTDGQEMYIFNIDTIRYDFCKPEWVEQCDGYLEVFEGEGEHWSFVEPIDEVRVGRTTEKERISSLCSDGLYYFKSMAVFREIFTNTKNSDGRIKGEFYIAPMYNEMIVKDLDVRYATIEWDEIDFCGTPDEYQALLLKEGR